MAEHQHLEVAEYMVRELDGSGHTALSARPGSGIIYNGKQRTFVSGPDDNSDGLNYDEIYLPCMKTRDELLATMKKYRKKLKQPPADAKENHSWEEVEESVNSACEELEKYASEDKNASNRLKRAFRKLCTHAGIGATFTTMIPNDSFNSVLCGGLKAIFMGLRQVGLYRQQVYRALEDLPYTLSEHAARVRIYSYDEELHKLNARLFASIFELLNHILIWFMKNPLVTGIKVILDPQGFSEELNERISQVKITASWFEKHALTLSLKLQRESIEQQYGAAYKQDRMDQNLQNVLTRVTDMEERLARTAVLQSLDPLLLEQMMNAFERRFLTEQPRRRLSSKQRALPGLTAKDFLKQFLYDADLVKRDCNALKKQINPVGRAELDMDRIKALQSNYSLRAFLTVHESSLILLNGRAESRPDSEVSIFSAHVVDRLLQQYEFQRDNVESKISILPAAFFCGQHRNWRNDANAKAEEAAMNLLLQLVDRHGDGIDATVLQKCYESIDPENITSICEALDTVISYFKNNEIVVLIMDGLRYFAQPPDRNEKTRELISCLVNIYRKRPAATLKFLFANPTKTDFVEDLFEEHELVSIARNVRGSDAPLKLEFGSVPGVLG